MAEWVNATMRCIVNHIEDKDKMNMELDEVNIKT